LSWDQRHTVKLIANAHLPWTIDFSAVWTYASGRPYTYYPTLDGFTPLDSTQRFVPNNARMESVSELDVKVSKRWDISDALSLLFYVDARNVFDQKNVRWVDSSGEVGGELGDITAWGYPRRVRIGLQLNL
jgi:hypothetical protein